MLFFPFEKKKEAFVILKKTGQNSNEFSRALCTQLVFPSGIIKKLCWILHLIFGVFWEPPRQTKQNIPSKPGPETFHWDTSVDVSRLFLYYPPDQIYQQMIVAEQFSRADPRGQKQRGKTACSLFPCPFTHASGGPSPHKLNSCGHRCSPAGKDITFTTGPKSKGSDLTGPSARCCVLPGCLSCLPLRTVPVPACLWRS